MFKIQKWEQFPSNSELPKKALILTDKVGQYPVSYKDHPEYLEEHEKAGDWAWEKEEQALEVLEKIYYCIRKFKTDYSIKGCRVRNEDGTFGRCVLGIFPNDRKSNDCWYYWYEITEVNE